MNSLPQDIEGLKQVVQGLENVVWEWALEQGKKALKAMWEAIDKVLMQEYGRELAVEHLRPVTYTTLLGDVRVKRRQCLDKARGKYRYPLDELLGMGEKDHVTRNARQRILKLAAIMSFRQSEEVLEDTPINLSHQGIWNQVKKAAEPHLEERDKRIKHFLETGELPESEGKKVTNLVTEGDG
ncbi:MAG: UPF0236 family protein, partial [Dehalococcoidia bacterium]|nr:UPF0236 family protein [Dehalococcoidia bacterium]